MNSPQSGKSVVENLADGAVLVRLGPVDERVISLTFERLRSLLEIFESVRKSPPKRLIITGSSLEMFSVGADINAIKEVKDATTGEKLAREGQQLYQIIQDFGFPTIAAISGPCVGGGCELALACSHRIISDHKSSNIGLPETKLGIIPGFGGTVRMPRLVGLPKALDLILAGKVLKPKQALACGLVDQIVPAGELIERAQELPVATFSRRKLKFFDRIVTHTSIGRQLLQKRVKSDLMRQTKGFYPAPLAALQSCCFALDRGPEEGAKFEARELGRLIVTPESKSLVHLFLLSESAKALGKVGKRALENLHAVVVGAGAMGAGIAGALARAECTVTLKDTTDAALKRGLDQIRDGLAKSHSLSDQEKSFILNRVEASTKDPTNPGNTGVVIEAIFEELEIKRKVLGELAKIVPEDAILATNTSSLAVADIAAALPNPGRVVGMHFFNPVDKMPLVEVVQSNATNERTLALICALTVQLGKFPIVVRDVPGFLVNRILGPYLNETSWLISEGYSVAEIDSAATKFGMPMGPIRLLDKVGLDIAAHASDGLRAAYPDRMDAPNLAARMVQNGRLGDKSGAGFYIAKPGAKKDSVTPATDLNTLLDIKPNPQRDGNPKRISERLVMSLINEAVKCLDEGVAGAPGAEAAGQIDLGSVMGFGFPPFRGGILHYANSLGSKIVFDTLTDLERRCGKRFAPANGIRSRAMAEKNFYERA